MHRISITVLAVLVAGCTSHREPATWLPARTHLDGGRVVWPVAPGGQLPYLLVATDPGHPRYAFLIDTGASVAVLHEGTPVTDQIRGRRKTDLVIRDAAAATRPAQSLVTVDSLRLGGARFEHFEAIAQDLSSIQPLFRQPVGGILGVSLFWEHLLTFDLARGRVVLEKGSLPPPDGVDVIPARIRGGRLEVPIRIGQAEHWVQIDSGAEGLLSMPASLVALLPLCGPPVQSHMVGVLFGEQVVSSARLSDDVRIGRHVLRAPIVSTSEQYGGIRIGAELLNHFVLTIDQRRPAVQFTRGGRSGSDSSAAIESPPLKSLGFSYRPYDPVGSVVSVLPDSGAARAGVQVGDEVRSVDGVPAGDFDSARRARIYERNEPVRVDLVRDGVPLTLEVPVTLLVP
jgi:hypothetical protein